MMRHETKLTIGAKLHLSLLQITALIERELRKSYHAPGFLIARLLQAAIWILIFGQAIASAKVIPTGNISYIDFIVPGILAQTALYSAIFYGIDLIWQRDMGILHKMLVTPTPRSILIFGRGLAVGILELVNIPFIYLLAYVLGVHLRWDLYTLFMIAAFIILSGALFSTLSIVIATIVKNREGWIATAQLIALLVFFISNSLYPIEIMPEWLQSLSLVNPLTYLIDALRYLMIANETTHFGLGIDFIVNIGALIILSAIATPLYPRLIT